MRVHIEPYGCTLNKGDARRMARQLIRDGHTIADGREDADAVLLVTCCVIEATENNMERQLRRIRALGKPVVAAGCMAATDPERLEGSDPEVVAVPPDRMDYVSEALEAVVGGSGGAPVSSDVDGGAGTALAGDGEADSQAAVEDRSGSGHPHAAVECSWAHHSPKGGLVCTTLAEAPEPAEDMTPEHPEFHLTPEGGMVGGIVPIASGCLGECAYCITRQARGELRSVPPEEVAKLMAEEVLLGHAEIKLTAQDTGAYGRDMGTSLLDLLDLVTGLDIPGIGERRFRIRVGMMNPDNVLHDLHALIPFWGHDRMFRFLHLPVQSGDDDVLRAMGRRYTVAQFRDIVGRFREAHPDITISTDVILGFPGETEEQFRRTVELVRDVGPERLNITRFSPRPGTQAWERRKEPPHPRIAKEWSREMTKVYEGMASKLMECRVGKTYTVLTCEAGREGTTVCRTPNYIPVIIDGKHRVGREAEVEITQAETHYLKGEVRRWLR